MLDEPLYTLFNQAMRVLFLLAFPVVLAASLAGILTALLQSTLAISDPVSAYAARLAAVLATLYFMLPAFSHSLVILTELALR